MWNQLLLNGRNASGFFLSMTRYLYQLIYICQASSCLRSPIVQGRSCIGVPPREHRYCHLECTGAHAVQFERQGALSERAASETVAGRRRNDYVRPFARRPIDGSTRGSFELRTSVLPDLRSPRLTLDSLLHDVRRCFNAPSDSRRGVASTARSARADYAPRSGTTPPSNAGRSARADRSAATAPDAVERSLARSWSTMPSRCDRSRLANCANPR